ncbi:MAG: thiamine pyrophosphate-dependent dehydrogenase E1 component subunit alpha [Planctomycetota bacterium]|nr:thiamine pyrophosphate-dependent dehydrogenase E1 component subunit alpha [Planctomycetota bacterium]MDA0935368.1 thiamine pyrophosphate-dependent dehydrogenase E1 component subunit alpha [Planctomycetota bacterium]
MATRKKTPSKKAPAKPASRKAASPRAPGAKAGAKNAAKPAGATRKKAKVQPAAAVKKTAKKKPAKKKVVRRTTTLRRKTGANAVTEPETGHGPMWTVLREDGSIAPDRDPNLPVDTLLHLYETMVRVREFDRRMLVLQRQGRIGFYGPILGQEAATVGSVAALEERDWVFPALREGAAAIMRGLPLHVAIAQLIGNSLDRCKGRQMPCHYTFREGNYHAMSSVIGTQITHAVGAAMAARIRGEDAVIAGYLGDGATSSNDFHAGMNFAAVYRAPVVLICQNNQWAISVPISQQMASETIAIKACAYGMPAVRVDGNDVLAVYAATREAVERARRGDGPTFLELVTYRRLGHSSSDDPSRYRDEAEVAVWERRDPVERLRRHLDARGLWDSDRETALQDRIAAEVNEAIRQAEAASPTDRNSLVTDVFADVTPQLAEQLREALDD